MEKILSADELEGLSVMQLQELVKYGKLKIMNTGTMTIDKQDLPEYKKFVDLRGVKISLAAAGRKYGVPYQTISRWLKRGMIELLGYGPDKRVYVDEADVAYMTEIFKQRGGQGKWVFDKNGVPYIKKKN